MKVEYDRESDILYIRFKEAEIVNTKMLSEDAYIDLDKDGNLVGIEIWRIHERDGFSRTGSLQTWKKEVQTPAIWFGLSVIENY